MLTKANLRIHGPSRTKATLLLLEGLMIAATHCATHAYSKFAPIPVGNDGSWVTMGELQPCGLLGANILIPFSLEFISRRVPARSSAARKLRSSTASRESAACEAHNALSGRAWLFGKPTVINKWKRWQRALHRGASAPVVASVGTEGISRHQGIRPFWKVSRRDCGKWPWHPDPHILEDSVRIPNGKKIQGRAYGGPSGAACRRNT
jgi:hypothetical protein